MSKHSEACCRLPPVISSGYELKGEYKTLNGLKTYVTGPATATRAILVVYDIFGFQEQTLQGADLLAHPRRSESEGESDETTERFQVFMPDFLDGDYFPLAEFPPTTDAGKKKLSDWFERAANPDKAQRHIPACLAAAQEQVNGHITAWAGLGFCWGGKMISMATAASPTLFRAGAQSSPARIDPAEALKISTPMCILPSKDEPADDVDRYAANLRGLKHVETFSSQQHGFMSARADLADDAVSAEYRRGYEVVLTFFHHHM